MGRATRAPARSTRSWWISPPTVALTSPAQGAATKKQKPTFSGAAGTATGDAATAALNIYSGTDTSGTLVQSLNASVSRGTYSVAPTTGLAEGTYSAQALSERYRWQ